MITQISVGFTYTKNLGIYASLSVDAHLTASVGEQDNPDEVYATAWTAVRAQVTKSLQAGKGGF